MFLTIENLISLLTIFGAVVAFIAYRAGKSDGIDHYVRSGYAHKSRSGE